MKYINDTRLVVTLNILTLKTVDRILGYLEFYIPFGSLRPIRVFEINSFSVAKKINRALSCGRHYVLW